MSRKVCLRGSFTSVIPWLDHGIQLKILKLLVFLLFFGYRGQATG
ncbi:MAG: hypothetical protein ACEY3D_07040 [Rickettsia sp.]